MNQIIEKLQKYDSLNQFHTANPKRQNSEEADYGCHWTLLNHPGEMTRADRWRVSYIKNTGEVYATITRNEAPVYLLGVVPPNPPSDKIYYQMLDAVMKGWEHQCTEPNSLLWVINTMKNHR